MTQPQYVTEQQVTQQIAIYFSEHTKDFITKEKQADLDRAKKAEEKEEKNEIVNELKLLRNDFNSEIRLLKKEIISIETNLKKDIKNEISSSKVWLMGTMISCTAILGLFLKFWH